MTGGFCRLIVIGLCGLDAAETGTAALYVDDDAGKVTACYVGNTFAFETYSGGRGRSYCSCAGSGCTENHVYCGNFGFSLKRKSAALGHILCHIFGKLGLGSDGVTEEKLAAGAYCRLGDCFVALHK